MKMNWKHNKNIYIITPIFLLVLIIFFLPNFLQRDGKLALNVGKTFAVSMNRAQEAFFKENNRLATLNEIQELFGFQPETDKYFHKTNNYFIEFVSKSNLQRVMNISTARRKGLKSYIGLVYVIKVDDKDIIMKMCQSIKSLPLSKLPQIPKLPENATKSEDIKCPSGFQASR